MADFEAIPVEGTQAEQAVAYILQRVVNDRNFSWYMIGTESLQLCLLAEAQRTDKTEVEVEKELLEAMALADQRLQRDGRALPEVRVLRERLARLDQLLGHMSDAGKLDDVNYTKLCDLIHRAPADWPEE